MKIFVTGGTGFIGSNFLKLALDAGHNIVAQKRKGSYPRIYLDRQPHWIEKSLDDNFKSDLIGCDVFVHFASHTPNPPYASLSECMYWNVNSLINLIEQADNCGIKNFLIAGSAFEYGFSANFVKHIHPNTALRPIGSYPVSKAAASIACLDIARDKGLKLKILRIFQAYGEGEAESRLWPSLCKAAREGRDFSMSSGEQIRDFISVDHVARFFINELNFDDISFGYPQIKNVGTGVGSTVIEFVKTKWINLNASGQLIPGVINERSSDIKRLVADVDNVYEHRF
jgi:nucleoside-diphosphate-sugar epimerase